jgi:hypothetical protein
VAQAANVVYGAGTFPEIDSPLAGRFGNHDLTGRAHENATPGGTDEVQQVDLEGMGGGDPGTDEVQTLDLSNLSQGDDEVQQIDLAGMGAGNPGIDEVQTLDLSNLNPPQVVDEVQQMLISNGQGSATYTLIYDDGSSTCETPSIRRDAAAIDIQNALEVCTGIGNVTVTEVATKTFDITFIGTLAGTDVLPLTWTTTIVTSINTLTDGGLVPGESFTLTFEGQTTVPPPTLQVGTVTAADIETALEALSTCRNRQHRTVHRHLRRHPGRR